MTTITTTTIHNQEDKIINGIDISNEIRKELRKQINEWRILNNNYRRPKLIVILIGTNPGSERYVQIKIDVANEIGIDSVCIKKSEEIIEQELLDLIEKLNTDNTVDGILVQLPLPKHINQFKIANTISCNKDIDGFNERNYGRLCFNIDTFIPCTALAVQEIIKRYCIDTAGKNCVIIGTSKNFGLPIAIHMQNEICSNDNDDDDDDQIDCDLNKKNNSGSIVTMCNINTPLEKLIETCRNADILITAINKPHFIKANMVKPGAFVIDLGTKYMKNENNGEMESVGDVDFEEVKKVARYITPVPGGVGPITMTMLMKNIFRAAKILANKHL